MAAFDSNGYVSAQIQAKIRTQEQNILASGDSDQVKAQKIEMLYANNGLRPGSFRDPNFNEAGVADTSGGSASMGSLMWQLKMCVYAFIFFVVWGFFSRHFPHAAFAVRETFYYIWDQLGVIIFKGIPAALNFLLTKP